MACIKYKIPILTAALHLKVNRGIVLAWMTTRVGLSKKNMIDIQNFIDILELENKSTLIKDQESDEYDEYDEWYDEDYDE